MKISRHQFQTEVVTSTHRFEIFKANTRRPIFSRGSMSTVIGIAGIAVNVVNLAAEKAEESA
jgi:hypothetical protein